MQSELFEEVKRLIINILQINITDNEVIVEDTPLLGGRPELDSMAAVGLIEALEERYGIVVYDDEIGSELFETFGSVAEFVEQKMLP